MEFDVDQKLSQFNNKISLNDYNYLLTDKNNKNEIYIGGDNNIDLSNDMKPMYKNNYANNPVELLDKKTQSNMPNQFSETFHFLSNNNVDVLKCCKDNCLNENRSHFCKNRTNRASILNHIQANSN